MKRLAIPVAVLLCLGALAAALFISSGGEAELLEPLQVAAGGGPETRALPADALVLTIAEGVEATAPFVLRENPSAIGGVALVLPKGTATREHRGKVKLILNVPPDSTTSVPLVEKGHGRDARGAVKYNAWARAYWRDSCSDSASLKVGDGAEVTFGNDCIYNCWHWVRAGQCVLQPGKVPVTIVEREDDIALDQLFFTRDSKYLPVGPISHQREGRGTRRFADDFSRSPGHGLEGWELLGGNWRINFSFDPNRIPNQYTLVGEAAVSSQPGAQPKTGPRASASGPGAAIRHADPDGRGSDPALALVQGPPWYGCKLAFSLFPQTEGQYGAVLDRSQDGAAGMYLGLHLSGGLARLEAESPGLHGGVDLQGLVRQNQWHRVVVERWAWVTRVWVDGRMVLANYDAEPRLGKAGLFVASGSAVFDDVELEEIHWQADDGKSLSLPWAASADAKWYRAANLTRALVGKGGSLSASLGGMALEEAVYEEMPPLTLPSPQGGEGRVRGLSLIAPGLDEAVDPPAAWLRRTAGSQPACEPHKVAVRRRPESASCGPAGQSVGRLEACATTKATLQAGGTEAWVRRIAFRFGEPAQKTYTMGPYHFAQDSIPDPTDYLDFTPEELRQMAQSSEADKFERRQKSIPVIGSPGDETSPWLCERGAWQVSGGVLRAQGPGAILRHAYELTGDMEFRCKLRFCDPNAYAEIELYSGPPRSAGVPSAPSLRVGIGTDKAAPPLTLPSPQGGEGGVRGALLLTHPGDEKWHDLLLRVTGNMLSAALDKNPPAERKASRGDGGRILLKVSQGRADFDDIEITTPRYPATGGFYVFQQQETDWWREGEAKWVDHGGNACVLASSWISLLAQTGAGMLWHKRSLGPDMLAGFDVEESSEWFGWNQGDHSHLHHPFDNICVVLAPCTGAGGTPALRTAAVPAAPDMDHGYRLEVNSQGRTATILYRNGKEAARVAQDSSFPIQYTGGHAPYSPRRNHITLIKHGALLRAVINGKEVLRFTDPQPLDVGTAGIGGYKTRINFSHVEVRRIQVK